MKCSGCGNPNAYHIRKAWDGAQVIDFCNSPDCGDLDIAGAGIPDVYLPRGGMKFDNLCDEMGRPYEVTSKYQKAEIMRRLGVSEAGDRVNGAPYGSKNWLEGTRDYRNKSFEKDRPKIREAYSQYLENVRRNRA